MQTSTPEAVSAGTMATPATRAARVVDAKKVGRQSVLTGGRSGLIIERGLDVDDLAPRLSFLFNATSTSSGFRGFAQREGAGGAGPF